VEEGTQPLNFQHNTLVGIDEHLILGSYSFLPVDCSPPSPEVRVRCLFISVYQRRTSGCQVTSLQTSHS